MWKGVTVFVLVVLVLFPVVYASATGYVSLDIAKKDVSQKDVILKDYMVQDGLQSIETEESVNLERTNNFGQVMDEKSPEKSPLIIGAFAGTDAPTPIGYVIVLIFLVAFSIWFLIHRMRHTGL